MFIKVGNRYINPQNITHVEDQDSRYTLHFVGSQMPLVINSGTLNDTSYSQLRAFLKSQSAAAQEVQV